MSRKILSRKFQVFKPKTEILLHNFKEKTEFSSRKKNFHLENRILNKFLNKKQNFQMKKFSNKTFAENFNVFILDLTLWSSHYEAQN